MPSNHLFLSPPSRFAFNLSHCQSLFQWVSSSNQVAQISELQLQHQSFPWIFIGRLISFRTASLISLLPNGLLRVFSSTTVQKNQSTISIHISPSSWTSLPLPLSHPSRSSQNTKVPVLYSRFLTAIYFTHGSVYLSIPISQFVPLSHSPAVSTDPLSMSAFLFLPWKQVHLYHFSRFHIYALIYVFLAYFTLYDRL